MRLEKNEFRQRMRARRQALAADDAARLSALAAAHVLALPELASAARVALYAPIPRTREMDTAELDAVLRARGKEIVYPHVRGSGQPLDFHTVADPAELVPGVLSIPQPDRGAPRVALDTIDLFVVPGLAFGEEGQRVGWGAGYYDRTLALAPSAVRVGYAYDFQLVAGIPQRPDDERMDLVVTDAGVRARRTRLP